MRLIWVTGISGAGKSTGCGIVRSLGAAAVDTDWDGFNHWVDRATSEPAVDPPYPTPEDWVDDHAWQIRPDLVRALRDEGPGVTFLFGAVENEVEVWELFDRVACLLIDDETVRHRLATRTTNAFGKHPRDLERVLGWNRDMDRIYRRLGAVLIDGTRPVDEVAEAVLRLADDL